MITIILHYFQQNVGKVIETSDGTYKYPQEKNLGSGNSISWFERKGSLVVLAIVGLLCPKKYIYLFVSNEHNLVRYILSSFAIINGQRNVNEYREVSIWRYFNF